MTSKLVELKNVSKTFGAVDALIDVSMEIRPGEVVGLIGENGAGKSTLLKMISGVYQPDQGSVWRDAQEVKLTSPRDAARHGIGIVHQEQSLVPTLTVAENILLGHEKSSVRFGYISWSSMRKKALKYLSRVGLSVDPMATTESLSFAQRQMVEIAKALAVVDDSGVAPVIILDEPTSVLEAKDIAVLEEEVQNLKKLGSVIFISHRLDEVLRMSDRVYVMRGGQIVAERTAADADEDELYRLMIGRETSSTYYQEDKRVAYQATKPVVSVNNLTIKGHFDNVSLDVHAGEALSIVGVTGSGREELVRAMFGAQPCTAGTIRLNGKHVTFSSPRKAVGQGISYIPAERKAEGLVAGMNVEKNLVLAAPGHVTNKFGFINPGKRTELAKIWIDKLSVRPADPKADLGKFSGGNQQKIVLGKWLLTENQSVLILDHPTRGLDPGAKEDVFKIVREQCEAGKAVIILPDTLDEALGLSHNIVVMRDGRVTGRYACDGENPPSQTELLEKMVAENVH
ncbi:MAG: sugar ABC transporter ATP-binding protein [Gordonia sp. (in: high G+C Gram-positive bacteria)]|nr:MAG: sugar ABC transporter ATP-binding protein [Gordonia sp. (in: high G+C Gram-positive bacteria)]